MSSRFLPRFPAVSPKNPVIMSLIPAWPFVGLGELARRTGGMRPHIPIDRERLAAFCRRRHIRKLSLFGSILRDDFRPNSDVDVLVEFDPGCTPGLGILDVEEELGQLLGGRRVDLVSEKYLNPRLRRRVLASAEVQYAEG